MNLSDELWSPPGRKVQPSTPRPRGEELWRLEQQGRVASCELRDDSRVGAGFEILVRHDDEPIIGRRCVSETEARYYANAFPQDYARSGWSGV